MCNISPMQEVAMVCAVPTLLRDWASTSGIDYVQKWLDDDEILF
jgi:hypothetical protein